MRLYELTGSYAQLQSRAEDGEDLEAELAQLDDRLEEKGRALVGLIKNLSAEADAIAKEEERLELRRKALENAERRIKDYVRTCMEQSGIQKIKAGTFTIWLQEGPERVEVVDEAAVPEAFFRVKREVSKSEILRAYKQDGECVPGTRIERSVGLRIR